jgi:tetratricopeptide (TPR) repeat protein
LRPLVFSIFLSLSLLGAPRPAVCAAAGDDFATYVPDPEIEKLIEQAAASDKTAAQNAVTRLAGFGGAAERALRWHLNRDKAVAAKARSAELLSRLFPGKVAYRVTIELQPDGSGALTLWSDRALLAECGRRYDRLMGKPERVIRDEDLKRNVYGKGELFEYLNDGMKVLESRVESRGGAVEATGILSFRTFDALAAFAAKYDAGGYFLLGPASLTDSPTAVRSYQCRKPRESGQEQCERNLLLFHDIQWEFILDFKGRITHSNAPRTDGSKLLWAFNCYQMVSGQAIIEASYDAAGLPPRPPPKVDAAVAIPAVVQANQPIALVRRDTVRAKLCKTPAGQPLNAKDLRDRGELVELDGRDSLPAGAALQFRWTQTYGPDLALDSTRLSQPYLPLIFRETGEYRFELVVSTAGMYSKPTEVKVFIEDDAARPPAVASKTAEPAPPTPPANPPPKTVTTPPTAAQTAPERDPAKARELHEQAAKLLKAFQYAPAKDILIKAHALDPDNRDCHFDLALSLMETNAIPAAIPELEELAAKEKSVRALLNVGHCHARAGNLGEARRWYRRAADIGGDDLAYRESRWQFGNIALANKDYETAVNALTDAEKKAAAAKIKDPRLLYDLARALHGCQRDAEALQRLNALIECGYTPDPQLLAEVKRAAEAGTALATAVKPPDPPPVARVDPPPPPPKTVPQPPTPAKKAEPSSDEPPAALVDLAKVSVAPAVAKADPPKPPPPEPKAITPVEPPKTPVTPPKTVPVPPKTEPRAAPKTPEPAPKTPPAVPLKTADLPPPPPKTTPPKPEPPRRKTLPPVPADFAQALAAGKRAYAEGVRLAAQNTPETKAEATRHFDEAEAMLQGAWAKKPGDESVMAAFRELAAHVKVIAIPISATINAKAKGLVALDAEPSIVPKGKPIYCVWEQVAGEPLNLRPEDMAQKKVGLKVARPGTYKFELTVSDGSFGGNPVTVTVEIAE